MSRSASRDGQLRLLDLVPPGEPGRKGDGDPKFLSYYALGSDAHRFLNCCVLEIFIVVFIRGFKRWVHGDQIKQIEEEAEDLIDESLR